MIKTEVIEQMKELKKNGHTYTNISNMLNVSYPTVVKYCGDDKDYRKVSDEVVAQMREMRRTGYTNVEIQSTLDVSLPTILKYCGKLSRAEHTMHIIKAKMESSKDVKERMWELRAKNYTNTEISRRVGRSVTCVIDTIGNQPEYITMASYRIGAEKRMLNVKRRKMIAENMKSEYSNTPHKSESQKKIEVARENLSQISAKIVELQKMIG